MFKTKWNMSLSLKIKNIHDIWEQYANTKNKSSTKRNIYFGAI